MEPRKSYQTRAASKASKDLEEASLVFRILGPLLPAFLGVKGRQILRLTCKQLSEDVDAYTRCLTLVFPKKEEMKARLHLSDHHIIYKCCRLERLVIQFRNRQDVLLLDGLPDKLQALTVTEVPFEEDPAVFLGPLLCIQSLEELNLKGIQRLSQVQIFSELPFDGSFQEMGDILLLRDFNAWLGTKSKTLPNIIDIEAIRDKYEKS
eukprot:gene22825-29996_t